MKHKFNFFFLLLFITKTAAVGQTKPQVEAEFIKTLNTIVAQSTPYSPPNTPEVEENKVTTIAPFSISTKGILSTTIKITSKTGTLVRKITVPVSAISYIFYDYYIGFQTTNEAISYFSKDPKSNKFVEQFKDEIYHIGIPFYGELETEQAQVDLQKALDNLLKYYKK
jgi:hypothetical protein